MKLKQFCVSNHDQTVWQVNQIKPLTVKMVSGAAQVKETDEKDLESNYWLVEVESNLHRSILRLLDCIPMNELSRNILAWDSETQAFGFVAVNMKKNESLKTEQSLAEMSPDEVFKTKKRIVSLLKGMTFNPNLAEIKEEWEKNTKKRNIEITEPREKNQNEVSYKNKSLDYIILEPNQKYQLDKLILAPETKLQMDKVILKLELGDFINEEWGLSEVMDANCKQTLNFQGPPGTGKTLAAKSIGYKLNKKILQVDYAQLFSKWVGETGKNIQKYFAKAEAENMILFFDEADALVMPRHRDRSNPGDSTNQNIFMQELDKFKGIVILTTNHFQHYDEALVRRFLNVEFKLPTDDQRQEIFKIHMPSKIKLNNNFHWEELVKASQGFSGGDIKNVIEQTLSSKATLLRKQNELISIEDFKNILRQVTFLEADFLQEIKNINDNKKSYKNGNVDKVKMGLIT